MDFGLEGTATAKTEVGACLVYLRSEKEASVGGGGGKNSAEIRKKSGCGGGGVWIV